MKNEINSLYKFAGFKFDCKKNKLWKNEELISISPKALELLGLLLKQNGDFVSKEEIFENIWAGTFVEDGVLTQNIYTLRKALGNDSDGFPLIENKTRLGYRVTVPIVKESKELEVESEENVEKDKEDNLENRPIAPSLHHPITNSRHRTTFLIIASIVLLIIPTIAYIFRAKIASFFRKPIESVKFTRLTNTGDLANATLSPDGNFLAFIRGNNVYLKDIATNHDIKLEIPNVDSFSSLQFSPDGNFLYFRNNKVFNTLAKIFKISRFGGDAAFIVERTWGSFSVSPDGKKLAFFRLRLDEGSKIDLAVLNLESKEEKVFTVIEQPNSNCGNCSPAWSPDGNKIVATVNTPTAGQLVLLNLANEKIEELKPNKLRRFEQVAWFPDGESFLVSASEGNRFLHLWKVFYPNLDVQPMTNGLLSYGKISISADGKKVLAIQSNENSNLFVAPAENLNEQKQLTFGNQNSFGQTALNWINNQKIIYSTQTEENPTENLAVIDTADNSKTQISNETEISYRLPTSDGTFIYFNAIKNGFSNIYQMTIDGRNVRALNEGADGQRTSPRVTNDGRYVYYSFRSKDASQVRRYDLQLNKEEVFFSNPEFGVSPFMELSPDNKYITFLPMRDRRELKENMDKFNAGIITLATENTGNTKLFLASIVLPVRRFSPDSQKINYILAETDGTQIVSQNFDGSDLKPIYTISDGRIFNFAWSKDGKKLAISRGQQLRDAVLLTDFDK